MKKIIIKVEKTNTGFSAYAQKYAAFTTGENSAELTTNMVDALNTYFGASGIKKAVTASDLSFEVQMQSVFEVFPINIKALSRRIGMNYTLLSQYANGKKSPSPKQVDRI